MNISTISVIGANGTMGCNISGLFASLGGAKVYMISRNIEKSKQAIQRVSKHELGGYDSSNLIPADYSMLRSCIRESDLVFESVAEDINIKSAVTKQIAECACPGTVVVTGTSGFSVTALAERFPEGNRCRYFGVHMFNPPHNITLCEVIPTVYSDRALLNELKSYLANTLKRMVVEVKDFPAFLGNRIGFYSINMALQYAQQYKHNGGIDYVDAILGVHTGRTMAPLATTDFVGLDIHEAIVSNIYQNAPDYARKTFILPEFAKSLIAKGKLGRKTNGGLYKLCINDNGVKQIKVYDIFSGTYREKANYYFPFVEQMKEAICLGDYVRAFACLIKDKSQEATICLEFLLHYIIYAIYTAKTISSDIYSADDVMSAGFNWCPPMALVDAFGGTEIFAALVKEKLDAEIQHDIDFDALLKNVVPSKYDFRSYFRKV